MHLGIKPIFSIFRIGQALILWKPIYFTMSTQTEQHGFSKTELHGFSIEKPLLATAVN
jgi:hypothetical protein